MEADGFSFELCVALPIGRLTGDLIELAGLFVVVPVAAVLALTEGLEAYFASRESFVFSFVGTRVDFLSIGFAGAGGDLLFLAEPFDR